MTLPMRIGFAMTLVAFAACACGDKTDSPGAAGSSSSAGSSGAAAASGAPTTGGSNATGGESGTGVNAGSGGDSAGSTHGGSGGAGGKNAAAGSTSVAGAANCGGSTSGSSMLPKGDVDACFGEACPMGECDNGRIAASTRCDDVYSGPVCAASMQCAGNVSGSHCLTVITSVAVENWVVTCAAGTPTGKLCTGGCGIVASEAKCL